MVYMNGIIICGSQSAPSGKRAKFLSIWSQPATTIYLYSVASEVAEPRKDFYV